MTKRVDGSITKDYAEILNLQYEFYNCLYTADSNVNFSLTNRTNIKLNKDQYSSLEADITEEELYDAMMTLKSNKCQGCDGLTIELFHKYYKELLPVLHKVLKLALTVGQLNPSGRRGIINLIPKKSKDIVYIKNWRPITLLNYDYKIIAKAIANRLDTVIRDLVGSQQTRFISGRSIHFNIMKTMEVVMYLHKNNKPGVVAMVDFEKCFDCEDYRAIKGVFKYFGFGPKFIKNSCLKCL